jgi:F0F1-type ATP synthase delta subunit
MSQVSIDTLLQHITRTITLETELVALIQQLEDCKNKLYTTQKTYKNFLELVPAAVADSIPTEVVADQQKLDEWLQSIIQALQKVPIATLTVAYLPSVRERTELVKLLQSNFTNPVVLRITTDYTLLAGAKIAVGSLQRHSTLQADLEELVEKLERSNGS